MLRAGIISISTLGARGERDDSSGDKLVEIVEKDLQGQVARREIISDDVEQIQALITLMADEENLDLILSTGGTGIAARDVTPEAVRPLLDKELPGIAEAMRAETLSKTRLAMLSRAVAGTRGQTLIITLPGSPKGVAECMEVVRSVIPHAVDLLHGKTAHSHVADSGPGHASVKPA